MKICKQETSAVQRSRYEPVARSVLGINEAKPQVNLQTVITIENMLEHEKKETQLKAKNTITCLS
jgi:hypothetical protein